MKEEEIHVRDIINNTTDNLWHTLPRKFTIVFDDGEKLSTDNKRTIYTSYYWDVIREYPRIVIRAKHHVHGLIVNKPFNSNTHNELFETFYTDIIAAYGLTEPIMRDQLNKLIYSVNNKAYNALSVKLSRFVTSIDILDFIEVVDTQPIKDIISNIEKNHTSIEEAYKNVLATVMTDPSLNNNALAKATRFNIVKSNQVLQCIVARGYNSDVDSIIFPIPVTSSYLTGMRTLYDSMVESRLAAKSLIYSTAPLEQTEYFARRIQILNMQVEKIHYGDCGSTKYSTWAVRGPMYNDGGSLVYKGDLPLMVGKYYLDEESNTLKVIRGDEKHLIGRVLRLRSVLAGCNHPDKTGICSVCFGELSQNVQPGANIGHLCTATINRIISQSVLSVRHVESSANVEGVTIDSFKAKYFHTDAEKDKYYINQPVTRDGTILEISKDDIVGLSDLMNDTNISYFDISRVTSVKEVAFINSGYENIITISVNNRHGMLTKDFIKFIKQKGWQINSRNNYVFSLEGWDHKLPIFILPRRQFNSSDHADQIARSIEGNNEDYNFRSNEENISEIFYEIFNKINSKLSINMSVIETVMYGSMTRNNAIGDSRLPRGDTTQSVGVRSDTMGKRSTGALMALQGVTANIVNPRTFSKLHRQNHPMDTFLMPKEVLEG